MKYQLYYTKTIYDVEEHIIIKPNNTRMGSTGKIEHNFMHGNKIRDLVLDFNEEDSWYYIYFSSFFYSDYKLLFEFDTLEELKAEFVEYLV